MGFFIGCSSAQKNTTSGAIAEPKATVKESRKLAEQPSSLGTADLETIMSMNSGFWNVTKDKVPFFGRYKAFIIAQPDKDYNSLQVYAEEHALNELPKYQSEAKGKKEKLESQGITKLKLVAKNDNFVWGSNWAGTEPTLTTNTKNSLVVQSGNEGIGRTAWNEKVIMRFNPSAGRLDVIGYDYTYYDKIDNSNGNCTFNFSTGVAIIKTQAASTDDQGEPISPEPKVKTNRINFKAGPIDLEQWKSSEQMALLKPCLSNL